MRRIVSYIVIALVLASCGSKEQSVESVIGTQDLQQIRTKKDQLSEKQQGLAAQIKLLNDEIAKLDTSKKVPLITTFTAEESVFTHYLDLQGNVKTKKNVLVYPEMPGQLVRIYVKEGQRVAKGQALAKIDDGGLGQQLAQVEAQVSLAKTTYDRQKRLWDQKIGSEIQYLQTKTNYEALTRSANQIKQQLGKSVIKAPFTGIVDDVIKEQGTVVAPGQGSEVFRVVNLSNMYIETDVPESYISSVKKGKEVQVEFPILGKTVTSQVRQAGNFINPANRTFKVEVGVSNKDRSIKPNLTAKLRINDYSNPKSILIPQSIISENAKGQQYVYVVKDVKNNLGKAQQVIITTGKTQGDIIEVLSGLEVGAQIVQEGARSVKDDQEVKILKIAKES
ncbi:RND family efflux transporter, MFP subunit [Tenacibaculum sp. MAR_2009_124]|uniref:efflux RND transporter periplasmic adaptor subunit n=1 Tax=Tenacibaculum sp. MAR_2009_124 TaxID=1250059 RepID=UPI0008955F3A|nr:efflux RND transporter periplasmic adaptor subunit [Tenacibaculum sp. MAR_2009_124]SED21003.1 RND family efflux transporter, MFP subunit [Tenacibaculum sp. MAR_2009_124]